MSIISGEIGSVLPLESVLQSMLASILKSIWRVNLEANSQAGWE